MLKKSTGEAYCWGYNAYGELGNGTTENNPTPGLVLTGDGSDIPLGTKLVAISAGTSNAGGGVTCVIDTNGKLYCWGSGKNGAVGNGTFDKQIPVPTAVLVGESSAIAIGTKISYVSSNNVVSCALDESGIAYCWGYNSYGQLGDGTYNSSPVPVKVAKGGLSAIPESAVLNSISAGGSTVCATDTKGNAYCWGYNSNGALGNGSIDDSAYPVLVTKGGSSAIPANAKITQISSSKDNSEQTTCAVADDKAYCWGDNTRGQLGDGTTNTNYIPIAVAIGGSSAIPVGVKLLNIGTAYDDGITNGYSSCGMGDNDKFYCWGDNTYGELGVGSIGTPPYSSYPLMVLIP